MQQINLYLPEFRPKSGALRSVHMLWGLLLVSIFLLLMTFMSHQINKKLQAQVEADKTQLASMKDQVEKITKLLQAPDLSSMDAQIVQLETSLAQRKQILNSVEHQKLGNNQGFSNQLRVLAEQSLATISVQIFSLQQGGSYLEMAGQTNQADQVPLYLQRLRSQPEFSDVAFGILRLTSVAQPSAVFDFQLAQPQEQPTTEKEEHPKTAVQMLMDMNAEARVP